MVKVMAKRFGWRLPFLAAALVALVGALAMFGGETRAVIALAVFDQTEGLLDQADAPTLLTDVLGVSERYQEPAGHSAAGDSHGSIGHYEMQLSTDPNVTNTVADAVEVTISVDDVSYDGMDFDGGAGDNKGPKVVELCIKGGTNSPPTNTPPNNECGATDSWSNTVTIYFATSAGSGQTDGKVGAWNANQVISVRAVDDYVDDLTEKKVRLDHDYLRYGGKSNDEKIVVTVTDNDARGIIVEGAAAGDTAKNVAFDEGTTHSTTIKLNSRPQVGEVMVTGVLTQGLEDSNDDAKWYMTAVGTTTCEAAGHASYIKGNIEVNFKNTGTTNLWNAERTICVEALNDVIYHTTSEAVKAVFTASNVNSSKKTDYVTGFVTSNPAWWTARSATAPGTDDFTITYTLTDTDGTNVGVKFFKDDGTTSIAPLNSDGAGPGESGIDLNETQ